MADLISFHNKKSIKAKYVARVQKHIRLDQLVHGMGWDGTRGCAVGCTLENYNHAAYETELGIPEWLARVEDTLFERMSLDKSKTWPDLFLQAIPVGVNLDQVRVPFVVILLKHTLKSMDLVQYDSKKFPKVKAALQGSKKAVKQMILAQKSGNPRKISAAEAAARAAEAAARMAKVARVAGAAEAAATAAWAATAGAEGVEGVAGAVWAAGVAAGMAEAAAAGVAHDFYANELLKLLRKAK